MRTYRSLTTLAKVLFGGGVLLCALACSAPLLALILGGGALLAGLPSASSLHDAEMLGALGALAGLSVLGLRRLRRPCANAACCGAAAAGNGESPAAGSPNVAPLTALPMVEHLYALPRSLARGGSDAGEA